MEIGVIIHPHIPKRKKRKPSAKARALQANWQTILEKYDVKTVVPKTDKLYTGNKNGRILRPGSDTRSIPSIDHGVGVAVKRQQNTYTGDAMIGIGQLHKSNAVPVFKQEDAVDLAKMRRG